MAEVLKQALASLCSRSGWCYAVFWKLKRRSRMVLTWEDGYYEFAPSSNSLLTGSGRNLLERGVFKQEGTLEDQIQLAVAKMSFHVYSLGEGIIGRVAFTGKHQWIFANGERISEGGPAVSEKYPDGWSNQFAAGIKTIAVVAVQQGVVQLGSTQMMTEDLNLVGQIRALFGTLQSVPGAFVSDFVPEVQLGRCLPKNPISGARAGAASRSSLINNNSSNRSLRALELERQAKHADQQGGGVFVAAHSTSSWGSPGLMAFTSAEPRASTCDLQSLLFQSETSPGSTSFTSYGDITQQADNYAKRGKICYEPMHSPAGFTRLQSTPAPVDAGRVTGSSCDISGSFGFKFPTSGSSSKQFDTANLWSPSSSGFSVADMEPLIVDDAGLMQMQQQHQQPADEGGFDYSSLFKAFQKDDLDDFNNLLASLTRECAGPASTSHFAVGDELSEALVLPQQHHKPPPGGPGRVEASNNNSSTSTNSNMLAVTPQPDDDVKPVHTHTSFQLPGPGNVAGSSEKTLGDIFGTLSDTKPEQLLDAIVAGPLASGNQFKPAAPSLEAPRAPVAPPAPTGSPPMPVSVAVPVPVPHKQSPVPSSSFDRDIWAASSVSLEVSSSSWTDRKSEDRSSVKDSGPGRKAEEPARMNGRKRLRPGEAPRPRPKDRQQIQDRVRELRDIVPNATKCSIDALLEKTIRHMKFLQSVTQHGDKWKAGGGTDTCKSMDTGLESGASWALEYDGKGSGVPILVENLKQPRQMLVEMLCEERGLFWEIAENIRGLGLTILKGVMESRNDKVWARFNVEGTKEVNRVKVLWNLTQLLKVNPKNCAGAAAAVASSFAASDVTDICSESHGTPRFQPPVASHAIAVSPGWT